MNKIAAIILYLLICIPACSQIVDNKLFKVDHHFSVAFPNASEMTDALVELQRKIIGTQDSCDFIITVYDSLGSNEMQPIDQRFLLDSLVRTVVDDCDIKTAAPFMQSNVQGIYYFAVSMPDGREAKSHQAMVFYYRRRAYLFEATYPYHATEESNKVRMAFFDSISVTK